MTVPLPKADSTIPVASAAMPPAAERESFVINLCSSTTPMALTQPQLAQLKAYTFFVSRRLEDGRERFRLHMGYFDSLLQAEELLAVVREIYPGAWAGEAPGKRLRARAAAALATPAPGPAAPTLAAAPSEAILARTPTLAAAPDLAPVAPQAPMLELVVGPPRQLPAELPSVEPPPVTAVAPPAAAAAPPPPAATHTKPAKPATRTGAAKREASLPFDQRSNVREVLKSLDESARQPSAPAASPAPPVPPARQAGALPESQVLHLLEEKRGDPLNTTSTPAAFAVQLQWSVEPIDLARVPSLAIFGAYTLYTVEGSREGRRWFGLRLGFFSDANSAKQVAQYVRSDFSSVAVVPVSLKERDGASGATGGVPAPNRPTERLPDQSAEFKLLDDTGETPITPGKSPVAKAKTTAQLAASTPAAPGKPATTLGKPGATGRAAAKPSRTRGNRVHAQEKRAPKTLEETLEILGAGQLQMEGAKTKLVSEGGIQHLAVKVQKNSPFTRLLDRLSERNR